MQRSAPLWDSDWAQLRYHLQAAYLAPLGPPPLPQSWCSDTTDVTVLFSTLWAGSPSRLEGRAFDRGSAGRGDHPGRPVPAAPYSPQDPPLLVLPAPPRRLCAARPALPLCSWARRAAAIPAPSEASAAAGGPGTCRDRGAWPGPASVCLLRKVPRRCCCS